MKHKNDYYYIIKLGIFQRKSEKTRHHFPNGTLLPRAMLLSENVIQTLPLLCNLPKVILGYLKKKKKKFYDFCVRCHIKTEESANQSKGCEAKLQGL